MGYEKRNSKTYFYQHHREPDGRKWKQYFGHGFDATMAANFLMLRKVARTLAAQTLSQLKAVTEEADELLNSYCKGVSELVATEMLIAGFHNPRSRGWRKIMTTDSSATKEGRQTSKVSARTKPRRTKGNTSSGDETSKPAASQARQKKHDSKSRSNGFTAALREEAIKSNRDAYEKFRRESDARTANQAGDSENSDTGNIESPPPAKSVEEMSLEELISAAKRGESGVMGRLRSHMLKNSAYYHQLGDLGTKAKAKWFRVHSGQNLYQRQSLIMHVSVLREQHLAEGDSPIEKLLIDEVLLCWLRQEYWIAFEADSIRSAPGSKALKFGMEQTRAAQRMYLKALAELRDYRIVKARLPSLVTASSVGETK